MSQNETTSTQPGFQAAVAPVKKATAYERWDALNEPQKRMMMFLVLSEESQELAKHSGMNPGEVQNTMSSVMRITGIRSREQAFAFLSQLPLEEKYCNLICARQTGVLNSLKEEHRQMVTELASGWSKEDIADSIQKTEEYVTGVIVEICEKLGLPNEGDLAAMGLIDYIRANRDRRLKNIATAAPGANGQS